MAKYSEARSSIVNQPTQTVYNILIFNILVYFFIESLNHKLIFEGKILSPLP